MNSDELKRFMDDFIAKNPWIESRLWDDDCICDNEITVTQIAQQEM